MTGFTKIIRIYFFIIFTISLTSCNKSEKCNNEIVKIENSFFQNKKMYNNILAKFIENKNINNDLKKHFLKLKINKIRKCNDYEKGEYIINLFTSEHCDYVIQSANFVYSSKQLVCKKTTKIERKQLDNNWYIEILRD